jgi:hypothetical protein
MVVPRNVVDLIGSYVEMPYALQRVDRRHLADVWRDGVVMIKQACNVVETSSASVLFPSALVDLLALRETEAEVVKKNGVPACFYCNSPVEVHCARKTCPDHLFCFEHSKELNGEWVEPAEFDEETGDLNGGKWYHKHCLPLSWNLEECFSMFGVGITFRDKGLLATVQFIEEQGYSVRKLDLSPITYIRFGTRVYPSDGYRIGDDGRSPLAVLPPNLVEALDEWQQSPEFAALGGVPMEMPENLFADLTFDEPRFDLTFDDEAKV